MYFILRLAKTKHEKQIPSGGYGEDQNLRYLVMSRLGPDVEAALKNSKGWSVASKAGYARQMLALLRTLHERCKMVFIDVKPGARESRMLIGGTNRGKRLPGFDDDP